jgi:hypothetical protein
MPRFIPSQATLTDLADDVLWHATGFAQTVFDLVTVAALGLALHAVWVGDVAPVSTLQASVVIPASPLCDTASDTCITAMVLAPVES